ncbi:MAG TPA: S41 family peptidase [Planctomycetota bacterium]|nr:S41 family peptidase [Planctomycetota bacterium]
MRRYPEPLRRSRLVPAALLLLAACASAPLPTLPFDHRRAIFDDAWRVVGEKYFDESMNGLDWRAVRAEYRPRAEAATTEAQLARVLNEMVGELHHSHVAVLPPVRTPPAAPAPRSKAGPRPERAAAAPATESALVAAGDAGTVGLRTTWLDERILVTAVDPDGGAAAAGLRAGDEILAIDGVLAADLASSLRDRHPDHWQGLVPYAVNARLEGPVGAAVELEVAPPGVVPRRVQVARRAPAMAPMDLGLMGSMEPEFEARRLDGNVLYVRFTPCFVPLLQRFAAAVAGARDAAGLVLDLRDNPGGFGAVAMGVARHVLQDERELGTMRMRGGREPLRFLVNPVDEPFRGPVVLVVNGGTGSTAEILGAGLQKLGRVRVVGQTSMGAALPSVFETIAHGWRVQVPIADFTLPDGTSVEGVGVVPDVAVTATRADFVAGRDPAVEAAVRELAHAPRLEGAAVQPAPDPVAAAVPRAPCVMDDEMAALFERMCSMPEVARLAAAKTLRMTSTLEVMGMKGPVVLTIEAPDKVHSTSSIPGAGQTEQAYDGARGWSQNAFEGLRELHGAELCALARSARLDPMAWREQFARLEVVEKKQDGARACIVVRQVPRAGEGEPTVLYLDAATLQPYRTETVMASRMGAMAVVTEIPEYADFGGIVLPKRTVSKVGGVTVTTTTDSVEVDVPLAPGLFDLPAKAAGDPDKAPK